MKTKNEMYQMLFDEIMRSRKQKKGFPQVIMMTLFGIGLAIVISLTIESDSISTALILFLLVFLMFLSGKLPLGKVKEPTKNEVIQYAKGKIDALMTEDLKNIKKFRNIRNFLAD